MGVSTILNGVITDLGFLSRNIRVSHRFMDDPLQVIHKRVEDSGFNVQCCVYELLFSILASYKVKLPIISCNLSLTDEHSIQK